jgi:hypothetical protein
MPFSLIDHRHISHPPQKGSVAVAAILATGLAALWLINGGSTEPIYVLMGIVGLAGILKVAAYLRRDRRWLIAALVTLEILVGTVFLDGSARAGMHYGLLALFCVPCIPVVWRSGMWQRGAFGLYVFFFGWALLTVSYSLAREFSIARLGGAVLIFCALTAIVTEIKDNDDITALVWKYLVVCGICTVMVALSAILLPRDVTWAIPEAFTSDGVSRFRGLLNNPNDVGALMLNTVAPILAFWDRFHGRKRAFLTLVLVLSLGCAGLADSRSPFVALAAGVLLYVIWRYRLRGIIGLFAAGLLMILVFPVFRGEIGEYIGGRDVSTLTGRTDIWIFALRSIREHPLLGQGYQVGGEIFKSKYFTEWYGPWDLGPQSSIHNGYLAQAVGIGIPATMLWLFILLRPWFFILGHKEDPWNLKPAAFLVIVPILVHNLTEAALADFLGIEGVLFGMVWAFAEYYRLTALEQAETARATELSSLSPAIAAVRSLKAQTFS